MRKNATHQKHFLECRRQKRHQPQDTLQRKFRHQTCFCHSCLVGQTGADSWLLWSQVPCSACGLIIEWVPGQFPRPEREAPFQQKGKKDKTGDGPVAESQAVQQITNLATFDAGHSSQNHSSSFCKKSSTCPSVSICVSTCEPLRAPEDMRSHASPLPCAGGNTARKQTGQSSY